MKIIIIRHGDPDNPHNTLTPRGFKEVEALAKLYEDEHFDEVYCSPLERAQITCKTLCKKQNIPFVTCSWLKEFSHYVTIDEKEGKRMNWDFMPRYFTQQDDFYNNDKYLDTKIMLDANMKQYYDEVCNGFDEILSKNGYIREGKYYRVEKANRKTLLFVCHFGLMSVLMSHLMSIPYVLIAQMFICPPSGVTTLISEEREQGIAQFRCQSYGDISHLKIQGMTPSFHGRFCEIYDSDERH